MLDRLPLPLYCEGLLVFQLLVLHKQILALDVVHDVLLWVLGALAREFDVEVQLQVKLMLKESIDNLTQSWVKTCGDGEKMISKKMIDLLTSEQKAIDIDTEN